MLAARGLAVTYSCPQLEEGKWSPGHFTLTLVAKAGPACCMASAQATATVEITPAPDVIVTPTNTPVVICEDSLAESVDVTFRVQAPDQDNVTVPTHITHDTLVCTLTSPAGKAPGRNDDVSREGECNKGSKLSNLALIAVWLREASHARAKGMQQGSGKASTHQDCSQLQYACCWAHQPPVGHTSNW